MPLDEPGTSGPTTGRTGSAQWPEPGPQAGPPRSVAARPTHRTDLLLLAVAVSGVSLSAPLVVVTAAPALAIAFWRNALAVGALTPFVLVRTRGELRSMGRHSVLLSATAGIVLALHFGLWLPSLSMTSVASSTALVTTTPIWTTLFLRLSGRRQPAVVWVGSGTAVLGVLMVSGVDLSLSPRALAGDALALGAGIAAAGYVLLGAQVRRTVSTAAYTYVCYATTATALLVVCLVSGVPVAGYTGGTWLKLAGLTVAAQLLGHSLINRVVHGLGPSVTATAILLETPGAALIAGLWLGQRPPIAVYPALLLILSGVLLVLRARQESRSAAVVGAHVAGPVAGDSAAGDGR